MDLIEFLNAPKDQRVQPSDLDTIAIARGAYDDATIEAFRNQVELLSGGMQELLETAKAANRELLQSEEREWKKLDRDKVHVLGLLRHVEQRSRDNAYTVPSSVRTMETRTDDRDDSPVLRKGEAFRKYLDRRGAPYAFQGERDVDQIRLDRIIRAIATGKRDDMTPLEIRAMNEGSGSAGQYLVPEPLSANIYDEVLAESVLGRAGITVVPMTSQTQAIAKVETGPTAEWKLENIAITPSDVTLGRALLTAHTLVGLVKLSMELFEDAPNASSAVQRALARRLAAVVDAAGLRGSGIDPEPLGLRYTNGVTLVPFVDTGSPADAVPNDFDFLVDLVGEVRNENFRPTARIYNSRLATRLNKLKDSTGQPLRPPQIIADLPELVANSIANDLGSGGSPATADSTEAYVGQWDQLLFGVRTNLVLEISREAADASSSAFGNLQVWIRAFLRCDFAVVRPTAFAIATGIQSDPS